MVGSVPVRFYVSGSFRGSRFGSRTTLLISGLHFTIDVETNIPTCGGYYHSYVDKNWQHPQV